VIVAARFPDVPSVVLDEFVGPFREALKGIYPICRRDESVGLMLGPQGARALPASVDWRFVDELDHWRVTLGTTFVALDTPSYTSRDDLLARFAAVMDAVARCVAPARIDRLGVRYVDQVRGEGLLARIGQLVRPEMLGLLGSELADDVTVGFTDHTLSAGEGRTVRARSGALPAGSTIDPISIPPLGERSWLLDVDASQTAPLTLDNAAIVAEVGRLAELAHRFFRWAVSEEFLRTFGGQP